MVSDFLLNEDGFRSSILLEQASNLQQLGEPYMRSERRGKATAPPQSAFLPTRGGNTASDERRGKIIVPLAVKINKCQDPRIIRGNIVSFLCFHFVSIVTTPKLSIAACHDGFQSYDTKEGGLLVSVR